MRKPTRTCRRTFPNEAFIRSAKSFYRTSPILIYPLSFTVEVGSHCVASWSLVLPWSYKIFTLICTVLIIQYHIFLLAFEVCDLWLLRILYPRCSMSRKCHILTIPVVSILRLHLKTSLYLSSVRLLPLRVIVRTPTARPLLKVRDSVIWWWLLF